MEFTTNQQNLTTVLGYLTHHYPKFILRTNLAEGYGIVEVNFSEDMMDFFNMLRFDEKLLFSQLLDVFAVDYPSETKRFQLNYVLLSLVNNVRLLIKIALPAEDAISVASIYPSAVWLEREVWDMFGIFFTEHPDLRRILTDYGFEGHPLRKDFPLSGYKEIRYDEEKKKIVTEPLRLSQEYRYFDFTNPWKNSNENK